MILEDKIIIRKAFCRLLEDEPGIEVIADTGDGQEAIDLVKEHAPDVAIVDLVLESTSISGQEALAQIVELSPNTRILVLTDYSDHKSVLRALRAGALGYLLKNSTQPEELIEAIHDVAKGQPHVDGVMWKKIIELFPSDSDVKVELSRSKSLTGRQKDVLPLLQQGLSNKEIATRLVISEKTVKAHASNIYSKLDVAGRRHL
ncbi:MAG: response regulator transcription factor [Chloroflexi bacterium]|nr:response regulator transcription factor [Chloroflexota bacterium]